MSLSKQIYDYFLKKARLHYINYIGGTFNILEYLYLALTLILVTMSFFQCKTSLKNMKLTGKSPHNTHTHTHTHTLDFRAVKFLFFLRQDLNPHHCYTAAPFALYIYIYIPVTSPLRLNINWLYFIDEWFVYYVVQK